MLLNKTVWLRHMPTNKQLHNHRLQRRKLLSQRPVQRRMLRDCELQHEYRQRYLYQHGGQVLGKFCCGRVSGTERHRGEFEIDLQSYGTWIEGGNGHCSVACRALRPRRLAVVICPALIFRLLSRVASGHALLERGSRRSYHVAIHKLAAL